MESPFDEAIASPFLNEPVKKKWTWLSAHARRCVSSTERSSFTATSSSYKSSKGYIPLSVSYRGDYQAPPIEVITFEPGKEHDEETGALGGRQLEMETVDLDFAVMHERHQDIRELNSSMKHLNGIQKGMKSI